MRPEDWPTLQELAVSEYNAQGIEEFSLDEPEVDRILGDRSYSGGDLPDDVLDEVEDVVKKGPVTIRYFFERESDARGFHLDSKKRVLGESQV
jgi:ribosomal protein L11 methyltransferase